MDLQWLIYKRLCLDTEITRWQKTISLALAFFTPAFIKFKIMQCAVVQSERNTGIDSQLLPLTFCDCLLCDPVRHGTILMFSLIVM